MSSTTFDWQRFKHEWNEVSDFFKSYVRNPIKTVRKIPEWTWPTLAMICALIGGTAGGLSGILNGSISGFIVGSLFMPFSYFIGVLVLSGFFYYLILFFLGRETNFKQIVTLVSFSGIFYMATFTLRSYVAPIELVGMAISMLILIVGFVDFFILPKKVVIRTFTAVYLLYFGMWVMSSIHTAKRKTQSTIKATPESLDILEKELKSQE